MYVESSRQGLILLRFMTLWDQEEVWFNFQALCYFGDILGGHIH